MNWVELMAGMDDARRAQAQALAILGFAAAECPYRVVATDRLWRLRAYEGTDSSGCVMVVAAPIKRPYIWDLAPSVSVIRRLIGADLQVFLLEWVSADRAMATAGLADYTTAISAVVSALPSNLPVVIMGHSFGGTLAAIVAALASDRIHGLVLISAPLCFRPGASGFRDAIAALAPLVYVPAIMPGSLLSQLSTVASPQTFIFSRFIDCAFGTIDPVANDIGTRAERWMLDEVALPGKLVDDILRLLYVEDRFCRGELVLEGRRVGPANLRAPILAIFDVLDEIAPASSLKPALEAMPGPTQLIEHPGEIGVRLQHLSALIGRKAHAELWPRIVVWLHEQIGAQRRSGMTGRK